MGNSQRLRLELMCHRNVGILAHVADEDERELQTLSLMHRHYWDHSQRCDRFLVFLFIETRAREITKEQVVKIGTPAMIDFT